jgi:hypothetical protein
MNEQHGPSETSAAGRKASPLQLAGSLTLKNAELFKADLLSVLNNNEFISIDCSKAEEIDLSFIQCVIAARRLASASGKLIVLNAPAGGALRDALVRGGFIDRSGTHPTAEEAFWTHGGDTE